MINITLQSEQDANILLQLIDLAVKSGGIQGNIAKAGVFFTDIIMESIKKHNDITERVKLEQPTPDIK